MTAQHQSQRYLEDLGDIVVPFFQSQPLEKRQRCIAALGPRTERCLKDIFEGTKANPPGANSLTLTSDIENPEKLQKDLATHGVSGDDVLYVYSCFGRNGRSAVIRQPQKVVSTSEHVCQPGPLPSSGALPEPSV